VTTKIMGTLIRTGLIKNKIILANNSDKLIGCLSNTINPDCLILSKTTKTKMMPIKMEEKMPEETPHKIEYRQRRLVSIFFECATRYANMAYKTIPMIVIVLRTAFERDENADVIFKFFLVQQILNCSYSSWDCFVGKSIFLAMTGRIYS